MYDLDLHTGKQLPLGRPLNKEQFMNKLICDDQAQAKPFLRWAGSKRSSIPKLADNSPESFNRYIEPFVGSAALFFHLSPKQSILSDLNPELINLYKQMKERPNELHSEFTRIPRDKETYYSIRSRLSGKLSDFDRAIFMLYLNRNCFNGLYRTNKAGLFNVPYASAGRGGYPSADDFISCSERLQSANVVCSDFQSLIKAEVRSGDFVYLDPPYIKSSGRIFSEYVKGHFAHQDMGRLSDTLRLIHDRGAYFLLSFIEDEIAHDLVKEWGAETYLVQRNISGFSSGRRKSSEIIIKNW
ncbi:DNA adenine methylase [Thalassospira sp.]|uniref:DNA adenine methylase n=1 Tax=Thalassospira sp. TaxID=1912094 RepID=UPI003AA974D4